MYNSYKHVMRSMLIALILLDVSATSEVSALESSALFQHEAGIWQIEGTKQLKRWVVIHNLAEAQTTGIFQIEVIGREKGKPAWAIQHLSKQMAITLQALAQSVIKPLKSGAVYPESFYYAYEAWKKLPEAQRQVCDTSVLKCLAEQTAAVDQSAARAPR